MVYSILLSVLHFKTILLMDPDWLLKISPPISNRDLDGNKATKMEHTTSTTKVLHFLWGRRQFQIVAEMSVWINVWRDFIEVSQGILRNATLF